MPTTMRRCLVASCFADVTQQIHSFRASGVMSAHRFLAVALDSMALRKSSGSLCTVPSAGFCILILRSVSVSPNSGLPPGENVVAEAILRSSSRLTAAICSPSCCVTTQSITREAPLAAPVVAVLRHAVTPLRDLPVHAALARSSEEFSNSLRSLQQSEIGKAPVGLMGSSSRRWRKRRRVGESG